MPPGHLGKELGALCRNPIPQTVLSDKLRLLVPNGHLPWLLGPSVHLALGHVGAGDSSVCPWGSFRCLWPAALVALVRDRRVQALLSHLFTLGH